jgi:hypothetical protein
VSGLIPKDTENGIRHPASVLFVRERHPGFRHARIALVGRLALGALGELQAVVGVVPENVRLFHEDNLGTEPGRRNRPYRIVTYRELRALLALGE